jgi:hypothetical protein
MRAASALVLLGLGCLLLSPVAAAEGVDGSKPLVCDLTQVSQCDAAAVCKDVTFAQIDLAPVFKIDISAGRIASEDGRRSSPIKSAETLDAVLVVHGHQQQRGWTMVIERATGHLSATLAEVEGAFVLAGACAEAG